MRTLETGFIGAIALCITLGGCQEKTADVKTPTKTEVKTVKTKTDTPAPVIKVKPVLTKDDAFTYANYDKVVMTHLDMNLDVNFDKKILEGIATIDFKPLDPTVHTLVLDTKDLTIGSIQGKDRNGKWVALSYKLKDTDEVLGTALSIPFSKGMNSVRIKYKTDPKAEGLQWLNPAQTAGKKQPYLFSQAQAINARTMVPVQDTPAVRITYSATLRVPDGVRPLMSAEQGDKDEHGEYHFNMPQPIPSYLIAIAVGDIKFKAINDHIGVYAEDYILDASADEFSETPMMEAANAKLYGPYRWGRYDMLVLPPSFPFGGMENPRLTFLTPTLIAGDKSLTNVVAHELAHSWSGNLVTNASWRDAWLNEGFTSYVENRVMEDLYGEERAVMEQYLSLQDLKRDIKDAKRPELTYLKLPADLKHPDDAFTQVAYVKGQFFLMFLENRFGRAKFDAFLKKYFDHFAFSSITTEDFLKYLHDELHSQYPDAVTKAEIDAWVYGPGIPDTAKQPKSDAFAKVDTARTAWLAGQPIGDTSHWSTHEWLHFINQMPKGLNKSQFDRMKKEFNFASKNAEIQYAWYMLAIKGNYSKVDKNLEKFLMSVGRGKFIYRLYAALNDLNMDAREWAKEVYAKARPGYHPIAQRRIDAVFAKSK
ncbi:MAG TPA: M1 family peptidase [Hellea balneolensis]|uniref:Aminopeptidase N n=1 Tax=Hellea balneolensis TaxID=287478 RepID=A0A7C5LSB5_9PROT|nr:M1 family peptidase [Hellea balneolensis]